MRHKWIVMLVVVITTMTTAQEALKQYSSLRAQAEAWTTLRLWTGFLNADAPQEETHAAPRALVTCSNDATTLEDSDSFQSVVAVRSNEIPRGEDTNATTREEASSHVAPVLVAALEDEKVSVESVEAKFEHLAEVTLLTEAGDPLEALNQHEPERDTVGASDELTDAVSTQHQIREVRLVRLIAGLDVAEAARPEVEAHSAVDTFGTGSDKHARELKARAIKKALEALRQHLDTTLKVERSSALREVSVQTKGLMHTLSLPVSSPDDPPASAFPAASDAATVLQDLAAPVIAGECASE